MNSLSPKEIQVVLDWGREELTKSLKVPAAFDIFQSLIQNGEINIPTISRKLLVKLGAKNGLFLTRLQKFIKTLQKEGADSINLQEHKEIYQLNLRDKKDSSKDNTNDTVEQETRTITSIEANQHGATQISKTVFSSGNNNDQKTILVTVSFDDKQNENTENQEKSENPGNESKDNEQNENKEKNSKDDTNDAPHKVTDIDKDSDSSDAIEDGETENLDPQDPKQQFLEAHKKFLYAREEARFKINQKINVNLNAPKVTFQPRGWQNLFTLTKSSSEDEEEEVEELDTADILVDDDTPFTKNQQSNKNEELSSYSDEETKRRRHHRHKKRRH